MTAPKTTAEIREAFLKYFEKNGHTRVESASLVPHNDPTLLFTAAGMVQFKDCFLGVDKREYTRATTAQKCVRAGGKHNDLENVGFTARHHTFFEMLGNFSFGDYFKEDAIRFGWEFVTQVLKLPKDKLRVTVHDSDDEAAEIWHKQEGVPKDRIIRMGDEDNFWQAGDTGPCGPCSEIFWDQGSEVDGERWLEIWNLVFMQFDRDESGKLSPLPKPSVDTGMGLERVAAVMQGVPSNYDGDLMASLIEDTRVHLSRLAKRDLVYDANSRDLESSALRVVVDHLRSTSFLIADGVLPSNEGRGYVLRRILRRALRFGKRLDVNKPFMADLVFSLVRQMGDVYPELKNRESVIYDVLKEEEERFLQTLDVGLQLLEEAFAASEKTKKLSGEVIFKLYDTFGFPEDLTALIARERDFDLDVDGFNKLMAEAQDRSRSSWKGSGETAVLGAVKEWKNENVFPKFIAYEASESESKVLAVAEGEEGAWLAIDPTPFYGEGGGQVGDTGSLELDGKIYPVLDSQKPYDGGFAVYTKAPKGTFKTGQKVFAKVDDVKRSATRANHTATHLLHAALRNVLGTHVQQAGSLVNPEKLRFDFSHNKSISSKELNQIEQQVNEAISKSVELEIVNTSYDDAVQNRGALALFSEKYGDTVRVVDMPGVSTELCGGLHVKNSSDIKLFKIIQDSAVAAGTRRNEALTGAGALDYYKKQESLVLTLSTQLKSQPEALEEKVSKLVSHNKELENEIKKLKKKLLEGPSDATVLKATFENFPVHIHAMPDDADVGSLRDLADSLRTKESTSIHIILAASNVLVTVDPKKLSGADASKLLKGLAEKLGGRGGGQARTAQGKLPFQTSAEAAEKVQGALA